MDSSQSVLKTIVTRTRTHLDEVDVDAKYTDDFMIRHYVCPSIVDVLARLNLNADNPVVNILDITIEDGVSDYALPPCVQTVLALVVQDDDGRVLYDVRPESRFSWRAKGFALEGNLISIDPVMSTNGWNVSLWYISNGDTRPHYSTGGGTLRTNADGDQEFVLGTPTLGEVDRRVNGYAGQLLRLLPASPAALESRVIKRTYVDGTDWVVVLRHPFTETAEGDDIPYEIAPGEAEALMDAVSYSAALKLGTARKISEPHARALTLQYRASMKTIGDNLSLINSRLFKRVEKKTQDKGWGPFSE